MRPLHSVALLCGLLAIRSETAFSQIAPRPTPPLLPPYRAVERGPLLDDDDRSGPRLGFAYIFGGSVTAENAGQHLTPLTTLFGWQLERQFRTGQAGLPVPMTELVVLVGGMEQGLFLPSVSWLLGVRKPDGWEAGIGPTLTGAGVQLALAAGVTRSLGALNVPFNVAIAPGRRGAALSITTGFTMRHGQ
jgi:hypothetical protein